MKTEQKRTSYHNSTTLIATPSAHRERLANPLEVCPTSGGQFKPRAVQHGTAPYKERKSPISVGMTCAIPGLPGMYRRVRPWTACRKWGDGSRLKWSGAMHIWHLSTWPLTRPTLRRGRKPIGFNGTNASHLPLSDTDNAA